MVGEGRAHQGVAPLVGGAIKRSVPRRIKAASLGYGTRPFNIDAVVVANDDNIGFCDGGGNLHLETRRNSVKLWIGGSIVVKGSRKLDDEKKEALSLPPVLTLVVYDPESGRQLTTFDIEKYEGAFNSGNVGYRFSHTSLEIVL